MKKWVASYQKNKDLYLVILGLVIVSMIVFPCLILGQGSYVEIHDQLDGEVLNYIYRAKYWLKGNTIPEFMNGMDKAAMTMPAPFGILFYKVLSPFVAFMTMQWFGVLVGFSGMYFLCKQLNVKEEVGFFIAVLFAYMPFYPVYGLSAYGQPLFVVCMLWLADKKKGLWPILGVILFAGFSSLTLVGYVWVALGFLYVLWLGSSRKTVVYAGLGWLALVITYLATNMELLASVFGAGFESHRSEMVLNARNGFVSTVTELLFVGGAYSKTYAGTVLVTLLVASAFAVWMLKNTKSESNGQVDSGEAFRDDLWLILKRAYQWLGAVVLLSVLAFLWNCEAIVNVRKQMGGIVTYFQADRVYWIFPFLWMMIFAFALDYLWKLFAAKWNCSGKRSLAMAGFVMIIFVVALEGGKILRDSTLNKNARLLLLKNYQQITWESFFSDDVFAQIDELIGADKQTKSVVSVGMYPSIPLYHGYICADGYSNNYQLSYKHEFRKIVAKELAKNDSVKSYFDDWGNRLYIGNDQYGYDMLLGKNAGKDSELKIDQLSLDTDAMKALNIGYVFSAVPIDNAGEIGLELMKEGPIGSENSFYQVWVYKVSA